ncbi:MAG: hypothetical protein H6993_12735 [Pseudomonadales bacterium]|nr:hypothetical protein [Pseudomonadales bacterium]MCP5184824.1 hypothetical protein [Pseudomonadales bacterium]
MAEPPVVIKPVAPPLSHLRSERRGRDLLRPALLTVVATVLVGALVWVFTVRAPTPVANPPPTPASAAVQATDNPPRDAAAGKELAPFASLEYERQLAAARTQLEALVQVQLMLKESMQVGAWGAAAYQAAMDRATEGDVAFQARDYEAASAAYADATRQFQSVLQSGQERFEKHLADGNRALAARDADAASIAFAAALVIRADDTRALAGQDRAAKLPRINELLRQAANAELAGRFNDALALYDEVAAIDPATSSLDERRAHVASETRTQRIRDLLTTGFAALEAREVGKARTAFNAVLALDPDNAVANGALQQAANTGDFDRIKAGEKRGTDAEAREDWAAAIAAYEQVLAIDGAIEFARTGLVRARAHAEAMQALAAIEAEARKLSSPARFEAARQTLASARRQAPLGPRLRARIDAVERLLQRYETPVDVTLTSDGQTDVMLSTVGALGRFSTHTVALRPGEYTLVGSRPGCRDVRRTLLVEPDMQPVSVQCEEQLTP